MGKVRSIFGVAEPVVGEEESIVDDPPAGEGQAEMNFSDDDDDDEYAPEDFNNTPEMDEFLGHMKREDTDSDEGEGVDFLDKYASMTIKDPGSEHAGKASTAEDSPPKRSSSHHRHRKEKSSKKAHKAPASALQRRAQGLSLAESGETERSSSSGSSGHRQKRRIRTALAHRAKDQQDKKRQLAQTDQVKDDSSEEEKDAPMLLTVATGAIFRLNSKDKVYHRMHKGPLMCAISGSGTRFRFWIYNYYKEQIFPLSSVHGVGRRRKYPLAGGFECSHKSERADAFDVNADPATQARLFEEERGGGGSGGRGRRTGWRVQFSCASDCNELLQCAALARAHVLVHTCILKERQAVLRGASGTGLPIDWGSSPYMLGWGLNPPPQPVLVLTDLAPDESPQKARRRLEHQRLLGSAGAEPEWGSAVGGAPAPAASAAKPLRRGDLVSVYYNVWPVATRQDTRPDWWSKVADAEPILTNVGRSPSQLVVGEGDVTLGGAGKANSRLAATAATAAAGGGAGRHSGSLHRTLARALEGATKGSRRLALLADPFGLHPGPDFVDPARFAGAAEAMAESDRRRAQQAQLLELMAQRELAQRERAARTAAEGGGGGGGEAALPDAPKPEPSETVAAIGSVLQSKVRRGGAWRCGQVRRRW